MNLFIAKIYAYIYIYLANNFSINIRGFGFLLRRISTDAILNVQGKKIFLDSRISTSYARLIVNSWNEPETHIFLKDLSSKFESLNFIDVGANIGEMVVDFSKYENVKEVIAFEPDPICAKNIEINCALNNCTNVTIVNKAISDTKSEAYLCNPGTPQAYLTPTNEKNTINTKVKVTTLDECMPKDKINTLSSAQLVMLIDVEGHEPNVIKGAKCIIDTQSPIIIFEYNDVSKQHFNLEEIYETLPNDYKIFRLNSKGYIDNDLSKTWNCVAIPEGLLDIIQVK